MDTVAQGGAASPPRPAPEAARLLSFTRRVASLSILLALLLELFLLLVAVFSGSFHGMEPFLGDAVQKVAWSFLLCAGLALGLTIAGANVGMVALAAIVAAPVASLVAHGLLEAVHAVAFGTSAPAGPSPFAIALLRGLEYACLGAVVAGLSIRAALRLHHHALVGLVTGVLFGSILLLLTSWPAMPAISALVLLPWAINEVLFPVGCAIILYLVRE
jgi:hypothetical protein